MRVKWAPDAPATAAVRDPERVTGHTLRPYVVEVILIILLIQVPHLRVGVVLDLLAAPRRLGELHARHLAEQIDRLDEVGESFRFVFSYRGSGVRTLLVRHEFVGFDALQRGSGELIVVRHFQQQFHAKAYIP
ncbi:hypothetical protein [Streptomyces sp. CB03238]|uniref:hypothetical protein n=1 Tax=Streptomyces sp. CB03238 TaxID=1907777 RepID=UPI0015C49554|nr:hypothetical protein [Streptomyces sp. CB03238]